VQRGYSLISKITGSLAYDTRNSVQLPDRGQRTELLAELAGPFGGEQNYYKLELKTRWYFKGLLPGHVLELVGGTGVADAYGSTDSVPFFDRYYLGGINTLRGFDYRDVGPRQPDSPGFHSNEPIGGDTYWFGSAEYSIPIIDRVRFAVFYDMGDVQYDPYTYSFSSFSSDWGFGVRLNLPIGPLRLDYGIPLRYDDRYNNGHNKFQFTAGYTRPF
jgi:outer membrane protein insertion porin family